MFSAHGPAGEGSWPPHGDLALPLGPGSWKNSGTWDLPAPGQEQGPQSLGATTTCPLQPLPGQLSLPPAHPARGHLKQGLWRWAPGWTEGSTPHRAGAVQGQGLAVLGPVTVVGGW